MILESCESCDTLTIHTESGHAIRDALFSSREKGMEELSQIFECCTLGGRLDICDVGVDRIHELAFLVMEV